VRGEFYVRCLLQRIIIIFGEFLSESHDAKKKEKHTTPDVIRVAKKTHNELVQKKKKSKEKSKTETDEQHSKRTESKSSSTVHSTTSTTSAEEDYLQNRSSVPVAATESLIGTESDLMETQMMYTEVSSVNDNLGNTMNSNTNVTNSMATASSSMAMGASSMATTSMSATSMATSSIDTVPSAIINHPNQYAEYLNALRDSTDNFDNIRVGEGAATQYSPYDQYLDRLELDEKRSAEQKRRSDKFERGLKMREGDDRESNIADGSANLSDANSGGHANSNTNPWDINNVNPVSDQPTQPPQPHQQPPPEAQDYRTQNVNTPHNITKNGMSPSMSMSVMASFKEEIKSQLKDEFAGMVRNMEVGILKKLDSIEARLTVR
jgi:hypothetical protein